MVFDPESFVEFLCRKFLDRQIIKGLNITGRQLYYTRLISRKLADRLDVDRMAFFCRERRVFVQVFVERLTFLTEMRQPVIRPGLAHRLEERLDLLHRLAYLFEFLLRLARGR